MSDAPDQPAPEQHPDVKYERTDVNARAVFGFGVGLAVWLGLVFVAVGIMFRYLFKSETIRKQSQHPIAEQYRQATTEDERLPVSGPIIEGFPSNRPELFAGTHRSAERGRFV